ncbi:MAG TPA: hypothetical protein VFP61_15610 [Acidimicrobiales bacterium]|nr:hypothetical protein [Acidimicrobiales bacterium]
MSAVDFYFDPVCPFAWITSKWVRLVAEEIDLDVGWRFISLRLLNSDKDYATHFPAGYEEGHTTGLRLLRVAAAVRDRHGPDAVGGFYAAVGAAIFESGRGAQARAQADLPAFTAALLDGLGLDAALAEALDDRAHDDVVGAETERALTLAGRDVGTPILQFAPPEGTAFFGPVISRLPDRADAVALWHHVEGLAGFAGFAEPKRSLREVPQLSAFGIDPGTAGAEHDWHQGRRPDTLGS